MNCYFCNSIMRPYNFINSSQFIFCFDCKNYSVSIKNEKIVYFWMSLGSCFLRGDPFRIVFNKKGTLLNTKNFLYVKNLDTKLSVKIEDFNNFINPVILKVKELLTYV